MKTLEKTKKYSIWLGTAGGAFVLLGLVLLAMGRWSLLPYAGQIALVLAPLFCAYVFLHYDRRMKGSEAVILKELFGMVWVAGVCCSTFLLNNVLQFVQSFSTTIWVTVVLLIPTLWFTDSIFSFAATAVLLFVAGTESIDKTAYGTFFAYTILCAVVFLRGWRYWQRDGVYSIVGRWVVLILLLVHFLLFSSYLVDLTDTNMANKQSVFLVLCGFAYLFALYRRTSSENVVNDPMGLIFSGVILGANLLMQLSTIWKEGLNSKINPGFLALCFAPVIVGQIFRDLRKDMGVLWLIPVAYLNLWNVHYWWLSLLVDLAVGVWLLVRGIFRQSLFELNRSLAFLLVLAIIESFRTDFGMAFRGCVMIVAGLVLIAVNLLVIRHTRCNQTETEMEGADHA